MTRLAGALTSFFAVAALAACATTDTPRDMVETVATERGVTASATVEAVNQERREVMLRTEDGRYLTVDAGPEVRNFDQIEVGDRVEAVYVESVVASMASAGQDAQDDAVVAVERAPEGARPGVAMASEVQTTVELVSYDPVTGLATYTTPEGFTDSVIVEDPAMRDFAAQLQPGDRVNLTISEAVAIVIRETTG